MIHNILIRFGIAGIFLYETILSILTPPYSINLILKQILFIGARSVVVIVIAGLFVGMGVALQFYDTLVRFGSVSLLGSAVGLSLTRELGPVLTALMVIGRTGSAMCAEIGIMRIDNQIDALETEHTRLTPDLKHLEITSLIESLTLIVFLYPHIVFLLSAISFA